MADCTPASERPRRTTQPGRLADLVRQGLRYVPTVARRYRGNGLDIDELIAAGNLGLVEAALRFEPERKVAFITYADWWVRKAIREALETLTGPVRLPRYRYEKLRRLRQTAAEWHNTRGRPPTLDELATEAQLPLRQTEQILAGNPHALSLDQPKHTDSDLPLSESMHDPSTACPQQSLIRRDLGSHLRRELAALDERQQEVIRLRFGLDGNSAMTLRQAAAHLGISRERVRQIELRALLRIRRLL
jgi:RNA polymerase sigma factor (sigma-70 family)